MGIIMHVFQRLTGMLAGLALTVLLVSGAGAQFVKTSASSILINEIDLDDIDAVELYNAGGSAVSLHNWQLTTGDDVRVQTFTLPDYILGAGEYVVFQEDKSDTVLYNRARHELCGIYKH